MTRNTPSGGTLRQPNRGISTPNYSCAPAFLTVEADPRDSLTQRNGAGFASDQGDAEAAFRLANLYAKGEGVEPDRAAANRLYQAAAEGVSLRLRSSSVSTTPPTATFPSTWCRRTAG